VPDRPLSGAPAQLAALRRDYATAGLTEGQLRPTWHAQFEAWLTEAVDALLLEPNAVVLATADAAGRPSARTVLLKGFDERGFTVFTNYASRKGREAAENPHASMVVPWLDLQRQVVVTGTLSRISPEESAAYFRTRPRGAQLGAWASAQSSVIASREVLETRLAEVAERFAGRDVPVPDFWGGLRLTPETVEFWQGRPDRLHDRLRYRWTADGWVVERLSP
jgi:pyridoxamine 5'-phosphate oxidase